MLGQCDYGGFVNHIERMVGRAIVTTMQQRVDVAAVDACMSGDSVGYNAALVKPAETITASSLLRLGRCDFSVLLKATSITSSINMSSFQAFGSSDIRENAT